MDPVVLQKQIRDNAQDVQNYLLDLKNWEEEMKRKEEKLCGDSSNNQDVAPVRSKIQKSSKNGHTSGDKKKPVDKPKKIPSYDYAAWDKFDADKMCELLDQEEHKALQDRRGKNSQADSENRTRDEAYYEKEMGNKFVKQQKWNEALECYTRAIECYSFDAVFYANRALCHLKLHNFKAAEADSSRAVELDPEYVKAYQRRATARIELKFFQEARSDLLSVLELEPSNSFAKEQLSKVEQKLAENKMSECEERPGKEERASTVAKSLSSADEKGVKGYSEQELASKNIVLPIVKPPHLRSKKPLIRIEIKEITGTTCNMEEHEVPTVSEDNTSLRTSSQLGNQSNEFISEAHSLVQSKFENTLEEESDLPVPPVPTSSVQFITSWNAVKRKPERRFQFLKQIPGDKLPNIFRESLESCLLTEIIATLVEDFRRHEAAVYPYLKGLTQVKRFGALTMFLSKSDKSGLEKLLEYCKASDECTAEELAHLRSKYEL